MAVMLPDFEAIIVTLILEDKHNYDKTLFILMKQYFQDIGLTEETNVIAK